MSRYRRLHRPRVGRHLTDHAHYEPPLLAAASLPVEPPQTAPLFVELVRKRAEPLDRGALQPPLELLFAGGHGPLQREPRRRPPARRKKTRAAPAPPPAPRPVCATC